MNGERQCAMQLAAAGKSAVQRRNSGEEARRHPPLAKRLMAPKKLRCE